MRFSSIPSYGATGVRPFHAGELPLRLRLIGAKTFAAGTVTLTYAPEA